jgi:prolyl 4-hydroxylase
MQGRLLNVNPFVAIFDDVFDADIAKDVIAAGRDQLKPAAYVTEKGRTFGEKRTNHAALIEQWEQPQVAELVTRLSKIVRLPPENSETSKLLHYEGDQIFDVHQDAFSEDPVGLSELAKGGQRLFSTLSYLSDVEGEGQTAFPNLKIAVRPKLGRVLVFSNTTPGNSTPHPDSAHVGFGPASGEKWVLSVWWREHTYHTPRSYPPVEGDFVEF